MSRDGKYGVKLRLNHNEVPAKVNVETGEVKQTRDGRMHNKFPENKSKLNYPSFGILNTRAAGIIADRFDIVERSIVFQMISMAKIGTNSLSPLNESTSQRELARVFDVSRSKVSKALDRLFREGVYMELVIAEGGERAEYWVLNPNIFWRARTKDDSLFKQFENTNISILVTNKK